MRLTENDIALLHALADYYVLSAAMIHRIVFPQNKDRRATRRRLQRLVENRYISRSSLNVCFSTGNAGPAYSLNSRGTDALAVYFDDIAYLEVNTTPPRNDRLYHWLDISHAHWILRQACEQSQSVKLVRWINEWQPVVDGSGNRQGFVLHTQFREGPKPLSCSPDAAFLLDVGGQQRVHFVEIDRGTTGAKRVAASKMPGFAEMLSLSEHRRFFPETTFLDFSVVIIAPQPSRRDILRQCVVRHADEHPELWFFIAMTDFTPESALFGNIVYDCDGELGSLVNTPTSAGT